MTRRNEGSDNAQLWSLLSEAGLLDIPVDDLPKRIEEAKNVVMHRLVQLAGQKDKAEERESEAYVLGILKKLETLLAERGVNRYVRHRKGKMRAELLTKH